MSAVSDAPKMCNNIVPRSENVLSILMFRCLSDPSEIGVKLVSSVIDPDILLT